MEKQEIKICLINPPRTYLRSIPKDRSALVLYQPMGLLYIGSLLRKNNYNVSLIDMYGEGWNNEHKFDDTKNYFGSTFENLKIRIKEMKPSVVGITIPFTAHLLSSLEVAKVVKETSPNTLVIVGGHHVTADPNSCLKNNFVDIAVIGEAEFTFLDIIKAFQNNESFENIKGLSYKKDHKIVFTGKRELLQELDKLPFPARDLLPLENYFKAMKSRSYSRSRFNKTMPVITSRGCPFDCCFCSAATVNGKKFRYRSPENVVAEIEYLLEKFGVDTIDIEDDNFTLNIGRAEQICDLIIEKNLGVKLRTPNGIRADRITESLIQKMKKAGFVRLQFSPESGVQRVVDKVVRKSLDLKKVEEAVMLCKKYKIEVGCYFVIGMIGETKDEMWQTIEFMRKLEKLGAVCDLFIATPLPGTRLFNEAIEKGYLRNWDEEKVTYNAGTFLETPDFSQEDVLEIYEAGMKKGVSKSMLLEHLKHPIFTLKFVANNFRRLKKRVKFVN